MERIRRFGLVANVLTSTSVNKSQIIAAGAVKKNKYVHSSLWQKCDRPNNWKD